MKEFARQLQRYLRHLSPGLTFDPDKHHYFIRGKRVRSVSTIVSEYDPSFQNKMAADDNFRKYCEAKAKIGTLFHKTTETLELNKEVPGTNLTYFINGLEEPVLQHCQNWYKWFYKPYVLEQKWQTVAIELALYHASFNFCGTLDRLFLTDKDEVVLVDYKTGSFYPNHEIQLALYGLLCENVGIQVDKYVIVSTHATKGGCHAISKRVIKALLKQPKLQQILKGD